MNDAATGAPAGPRVRATELQFRLLAAEQPPAPGMGGGPPKAGADDPAAAIARLLDPWQAAQATARVFWRLPAGDAVEIPFRDPAELLACLEFEHVLDGAGSVDWLVRQLDLAALQAVSRAAADAAVPGSASTPGAIARSGVLEELRRHPGLLARLEAPMAGVPWDLYFVEKGEAPAWTDDIALQLSPPQHMRLLLQAADAVTAAMATLRLRILKHLREAETTARGLLDMALDSALNEIYGEGLRYFDFQSQGGIVAAFQRLKAPMAKANDKGGSTRPPQVAALPVARVPAQLQEALKRLKPAAQEVLDAEERLARTAPHVVVDRPVGPNPEYAKASAALDKARQQLAVQAGKLREACPIVLRMSAKQIAGAAAAPRDELGAMLFPILVRAWEANRRTRQESAGWPLMATGLKDTGWPEVELAVTLERDVPAGGIWAYRKYVERAISRLSPDTTSIGYTAAEYVLDRAHGKSHAAELAAALIRDLVIFQAAEGIDKRVAAKSAQAAAAGTAEAAARKLPRLVPVLNWAYAGWGIYTGLRDFGQQSDRFYCTLDPADSLVEIEPSVGALAGSIAMEVAFALI